MSQCNLPAKCCNAMTALCYVRGVRNGSQIVIDWYVLYTKVRISFFHYFELIISEYVRIV